MTIRERAQIGFEGEEVIKVTGSKKRHAAVKREDLACREQEEAGPRERESTERGERTRDISTAVRVVLMFWEIIWTLVRDHVIRGTGPGRLL
jgi:hypothetical protein